MSQSHECGGPAQEPTVTVIHGRQRHVVRLRETIRELMEDIAEIISVKPDEQMLIVGGKKFSAQDDVNLASIGLRKGKKVMVMKNGLSRYAEPSSSVDMPSGEEDVFLQRIRQCTSELSSIESAVSELKKQIMPPNSELKNMSPSELEGKKMKVRTVSERCMKVLIALDSIIDEGRVGGRGPAAWKTDRKNAVDRLQKTLGSIDELLKIIENVQGSLVKLGDKAT